MAIPAASVPLPISGRAKATLIFLALNIACEALSLGHSAWMLSFIEAARRGDADIATGERIDAVGTLIGLLFLASFLGATISFCMWFHRAVRNAHRMAAGLSPDDLATAKVDLSKAPTPGWAVGSFFIPILYLFRPVQAMLFAWRASAAAANLPKSAGIIGFWWTFWLVSNMLSNVSFRLSLNTSEENQTLDWLAGMQWLDIASSGTGIASGMLAIAVVRGLSGMQQPSTADPRIG